MNQDVPPVPGTNNAAVRVLPAGVPTALSCQDADKAILTFPVSPPSNGTRPHPSPMSNGDGRGHSSSIMHLLTDRLTTKFTGW